MDEFHSTLRRRCARITFGGPVRTEDERMDEGDRWKPYDVRNQDLVPIYDSYAVDSRAAARSGHHGDHPGQTLRGPADVEIPLEKQQQAAQRMPKPSAVANKTIRKDCPNWILIAGGAMISALGVIIVTRQKPCLPEPKAVAVPTRRNESHAQQPRPSSLMIARRESSDSRTSELSADSLYSGYPFMEARTPPQSLNGGSRVGSDWGEDESKLSSPTAVDHGQFARSLYCKNRIVIIPTSPPGSYRGADTSATECNDLTGTSPPARLDASSRRGVVYQLRRQLKSRDVMILDMQAQISEQEHLISVQQAHCNELQSQLEAANVTLLESNLEIQRLRLAATENIVGQFPISGNWALISGRKHSGSTSPAVSSGPPTPTNPVRGRITTESEGKVREMFEQAIFVSSSEPATTEPAITTPQVGGDLPFQLEEQCGCRPDFSGLSTRKPRRGFPTNSGSKKEQSVRSRKRMAGGMIIIGLREKKELFRSDSNTWFHRARKSHSQSSPDSPQQKIFLKSNGGTLDGTDVFGKFSDDKVLVQSAPGSEYTSVGGNPWGQGSSPGCSRGESFGSQSDSSTARIERPTIGDREVNLESKIDNGKSSLEFFLSDMDTGDHVYVMNQEKEGRQGDVPAEEAITPPLSSEPFLSSLSPDSGSIGESVSGLSTAMLDAIKASTQLDAGEKNRKRPKSVASSNISMDSSFDDLLSDTLVDLVLVCSTQPPTPADTSIAVNRLLS